MPVSRRFPKKLKQFKKDKEKINMWIKGELPKRSGKYKGRENEKEGRDDFTTNGNHWWNVGNIKHPEEIEWDDESFKPL